MIGSNFEAVQSGFDKFVGEGTVESLPGVPKIRPEEIIIVLLDQATLEALGRSISDRPVGAEHARNCLRSYKDLADRYHGCVRVVCHRCAFELMRNRLEGAGVLLYFSEILHHALCAMNSSPNNRWNKNNKLGRRRDRKSFPKINAEKNIYSLGSFN